MIQAEQFVEAARARGYQTYTGVPCSFLTPFINYVINDDKLSYISSANEGDALATAAGAAIGGKRAVVMLQNSGLGNAVSPITSLSYVFRIPTLMVCTHRGAPGIQDEPQHELMGRITGSMFDIMRVPWEGFPTGAEDIDAALARAQDYMEREQRPYGFLMQGGTVAKHELRRRSPGDVRGPGEVISTSPAAGTERPSRNEALRRLVSLAPETHSVIIATTGYTGRELYALSDRSNQFYMVGSMGCASSLGLGLSLARPDLKVIVIDGDGAALMRMGNFSTVGAYGGDNFYHIVLDNEAHESTGGQSTVSASVAFAKIAQACGYGLSIGGDTPDIIDTLLRDTTHRGPKLAHVKIATGTIEDLPRPKITPPEVVRRLMNHIRTRF
ncbi:MAG: phosphonopyruvate decarboxylase [Chromatiales bacterium]